MVSMHSSLSFAYLMPVHAIVRLAPTAPSRNRPSPAQAPLISNDRQPRVESRFEPASRLPASCRAQPAYADPALRLPRSRSAAGTFHMLCRPPRASRSRPPGRVATRSSAATTPQQPVRRQATLQRRGGWPIEVRQVPPRDCAQPREVQVRVLDLQRIEGPLHQLECRAQAHRRAAPASALCPGPAFRYSGSTAKHVRVQIRLAHRDTPAAPSQSPPCRLAVERADHLAADPLRHQKHPLAGSDRRRCIPRPQVCSSTQRSKSSSSVSGHAISRSRLLSSVRSRSLCSLCVSPLRRRPQALPAPRAELLRSASDPASRSLHALQSAAGTSHSLPRSADSGSTRRCRARFTAVNSRSPNSSSTVALDALRLQPPPQAPLSLRRSLAKSPSASGQSKPTLAALDPSFAASIIAGMVRGTSSSSDPAPALPALAPSSPRA